MEDPVRTFDWRIVRFSPPSAQRMFAYLPEKVMQRGSRLAAVRSKLKCPLFVASEVSGIG
jgi:hypothetical protein